MMLQRGLIRSLINGKLSTSDVAEKIDETYFIQFKSRGRREHSKESDNVIEAIAMKHEDVIVLNRMDYACDEEANSCFSINEQLEKFYYDYGHHTLEGASFFGKRVDQVHWLEKLR